MRRTASSTALAGESRTLRKKRKIIGRVNSSRCSTRKLTSSRASSGLRRGRSIPDVIESAGSKTGKAHVIKSHHNVGGLPEDMRMQLVEPLRELFKDEVRKIGMELGLAARDGLCGIRFRVPAWACAFSAR